MRVRVFKPQGDQVKAVFDDIRGVTHSRVVLGPMPRDQLDGALRPILADWAQKRAERNKRGG